jgi:hypothetical protein
LGAALEDVVQGNGFGRTAAGVFVAKGIGEDELGVFPGFEGDLVDAARKEEEYVFGKEEVHQLVLLFGAGVCLWWGV